MPRHLISDAHEWINEILTVPIYYLAKPQPSGWGFAGRRGVDSPRRSPKARSVPARGRLDTDNGYAVVC